MNGKTAAWRGLVLLALGGVMGITVYAAARGPKEAQMVQDLLPVVLTDDVDRLKVFYRDTVGLRIESDEGNFIRFSTGRSSLAVMHRGVVGRIAGERGGIRPGDKGFRCELYFLVKDAKLSSERLKKAGAPVVSSLASRPWGQRAAYFLDPDENLIAVADSKT